MAYITSLTPGQVHAITQNVVYALPSRRCMVHADAVVEVNTVSGTTGWDALTGANTVGAETAAAFIRCTTGNTNVSVKV